MIVNDWWFDLICNTLPLSLSRSLSISLPLSRSMSISLTPNRSKFTEIPFSVFQSIDLPGFYSFSPNNQCSFNWIASIQYLKWFRVFCVSLPTDSQTKPIFLLCNHFKKVFALLPFGISGYVIDLSVASIIIYCQMLFTWLVKSPLPPPPRVHVWMSSLLIESYFSIWL